MTSPKGLNSLRALMQWSFDISHKIDPCLDVVSLVLSEQDSQAYYTLRLHFSDGEKIRFVSRTEIFDGEDAEDVETYFRGCAMKMNRQLERLNTKAVELNATPDISAHNKGKNVVKASKEPAVVV